MMPPRLRPPTEKVVQRQIVYTVKSLGGHAASTSQYRASGVALGLPDLLIAFPQKGVAFFFEVKGREYRKRADDDPLKPLRPQQALWREVYERCGWRYYWGDHACLMAALGNEGITEAVTMGRVEADRVSTSMQERREFLASLHHTTPHERRAS